MPQVTVRVPEGTDNLTPFTIYSADFDPATSISHLAVQLKTVVHEACSISTVYMYAFSHILSLLARQIVCGIAERVPRVYRYNGVDHYSTSEGQLVPVREAESNKPHLN
jgi:hypothetical protein